MNFGTIRLALGVVWLGVAAVAAAWPAGLRWDGGNGGLIALATLALAVWNLGRWYFARPVPAPEWSPLRRRGEPREGEYHPEFDLTKRDDG